MNRLRSGPVPRRAWGSDQARRMPAGPTRAVRKTAPSSRGFCPRPGRWNTLGVGGAAFGAIEDEFDRGDLDAVSSRMLGTIERVVGLRQQRREIEYRIAGNDNADAHRAGDRTPVDLARGGGESASDLLGNHQRTIAAGVVQQRPELLPAPTTEQVDAAQAAACDLGENF